MRADRSARSVLFVCTGNIFRSLTAEYALKQHLGSQRGDFVGSAGIEATPQLIHPFVRALLLERGADPAGHIQRKLTQSLRDHQEALRRSFGLAVPLFNQICFGRDEPILDVHEALPDWKQNDAQARAYVRSVVDHIYDAMPHLAARLPHLR